ncbi:hypothetical protein Scep_022172 [Stephania cephalantha]|uniref:WIT1/2 N-terminal helical bundle domain-containing protein n=1 Tax=Stephania cephalantha TaxID=152367 RepID=A0AAP0HXH7_9MAGN
MGMADDTDVNATIHSDGTYASEEMREVSAAGEVLTRVELHLAYSSEKLLNLDILLMNVIARESDYESLIAEDEDISDNSIEKGFEFDLLIAIIDSEAMELEKLMASLQLEIVDAREKISSSEHLRDFFSLKKLQDSEESLKGSQDQVAEIRMQSANFHKKIVASAAQENCDDSKDVYASEIGHFSCLNTRVTLQSAEQKKHVLRMLEKSLARELDLEEKLLEARLAEEELKQKFYSAEQELFCIDQATEDIFGRFFEAENAAEVLKGISKEILGRLELVQFNLTASTQREAEMRCKLQQFMEETEAKGSIADKLGISGSEFSDLIVEQRQNLEARLRETEDEQSFVNSEASSLREKILLLEELLKEREIETQDSRNSMEESQKQQDTLRSELREIQNTVEDLKANISEAESRAESAGAKCVLLTETNSELNEELSFLKGSGNDIEKMSLLEKQLRESNILLQHARASAEASQEQQNMLYSAIEDMENLINDLKSKVLKAESRAEIAEERCDFLVATNLELDKEVGFLRSRMEFIENSLHQAEDAKLATVKELNIRTKVITDLVLQLAIERERLHKQVSLLKNENKVMMEFRKIEKAASEAISCKSTKSKEVPLSDGDSAKGVAEEVSEKLVEESSTISFHTMISENLGCSRMNKSATDESTCDADVNSTISAEEDVDEESDLETVRTVEARQSSVEEATNFLHLASMVPVLKGKELKGSIVYVRDIRMSGRRLARSGKCEDRMEFGLDTNIRSTVCDLTSYEVGGNCRIIKTIHKSRRVDGAMKVINWILEKGIDCPK